MIDRVVRWEVERQVGEAWMRSYLSEDLAQDFFVHLCERGAARLRSFRGNTEAEFRVFIRVAAVRFIRRGLSRWRRGLRREAGAAIAAGCADRGRPTERDVRVACDELEALLGRRDRARWAAVAAWLSDPGASEGPPEAGHGSTSERNCRRWRDDLYSRYASRLA